tara:strand:- start:560 stop:3307 length:2748 start_codon:yes stop_codon:yes gene_type:complete
MSYSNAQYSDLLRAVNQTGSVYNYGNPQFVNPYSGAAYSPFNYREIMSRKTAPVDPRSAYTDYDPTAGRIATGAMGYQIGSEGLVPAAKGIYSSLAQKSYGGSTVGLTAGATLYGAGRDQNPYELGTFEQISNVASPALAGATIGPMIASGAAAGPIGAIVGLMAGIFMNEAQKRKTEQANIDAEETFQEERTEYTEDIAKEAEEQREQYALGAEADIWGQEASKYSNQYGAYANPYGQSYYDKGGKMKLYNGGGGYGDPPSVWGCMDSVAYNYNPQATMDDGSCIFREDEIKPNVENLNPDQLSDEQLDMVTEWGTTWLPSIERPPYEPPIQRLTKEKAPISEIVEEPISPRSNVFLKDKRTSAAPEDLEAYRWDLLNPYIRENVDIFDKGGKLTSKKKSKLKKLGRHGDTELAHVNPQEKAMLKAMGGSGTTNPYTGLKEYHASWNVGHMLGHGVDLVTSPIEFISDVIGGEEDAFGQFVDNLTFGEAGMGPDQTKTAIYNEETGGYEIQTSQPGTTLGFDPTGETAGSAQLHLQTPTGVGGAQTGQAIYGDPWYGESPAYKGAAPRSSRQRATPEDKIKVVNPFQSGFGGPEGDKQASAMGLENYRWDLANPYIRENVDIFDEGGVLQSESLPVDSMFNRQLFVESSFNPSAESDAGALGLSQITEPTFNDMIGWGWVPEGKEFSDLKTDTDLAVNLQERYMNDLMSREWNTGSEDVVKAKALAAYNMGPTGLVKELNKLKSQDVDIYNSLDWINQLNSETKNYVNKIMLGGNEKFEQDYTKSWKAGGKNYDQGGITNAVAEFTGNEMIVNNQAVVEAGIKENNPSKAAGPIRLAMQEGFVTPGQETHGGNPMPVDDQGFIYTKGGKLPFKVRKGAGIYDHATDQFKQDMTDEQIMAVAKNNINKWEKNNMN